MKSTVFWALIVINVMLAAAFIGRFTRENAALAQQQQPARRPGDYIFVPADFGGLSQGVLVVVDQINGQLSALTFDDSNRRIDVMPKVELGPIFQRGPINPQRQPR